MGIEMNTPKKALLGTGICLLALVLALAIAAVSFLSKPEVHQGRTVRQWVSLLDMDVNRKQEREEASQALIRIGASALPEVERILAWRPERWESLRNRAIRLGLVQPHPIHPRELQSRACEAAYTLAERADVDISGLVPHLEYHLTNGTYADSNSGRALAAAGPQGVAVLTNLLQVGGRSVRDNAGAALRHVDQRPEVIDALIRSANGDPDPGLRANAVLYLAGSRGLAHQLVPLGLKFLQSDDGYQRWAGANLLQDYRTNPEARTALQAALSDPDERVRSASQRALTDDAR
jgi:hypothetical protein